MPEQQIYSISEESLAIFDKYWKNREASTTPQFYNKMNVIQKELIELHYKKMDTDSKIRSQETLKMLNKKIDKYNEENPVAYVPIVETKPTKTVRRKTELKLEIETLSTTEINKVIEAVDSLLENPPLEIETKPKSTRSRGKGGRSTKAISDVP